MSLALPGVFSGIDTDSLVAQLMAVNRRPLALLENRKALCQSRQVAVGELESRLIQLKALAESLRGAVGLRRVIASSSDADVATATAGEGAGEGVHQITVGQLARGHRVVHTSGLASLETTVGAAKSTALNRNGVAEADSTTWFTTTANGATYTFDFGDEADITNVVFAAGTGYSMNQVAALINARSQAVSGYDAASVAFDSQTNEYYLRLTANSSGTTGVVAQVLTAGDAIDQINDDADWNKTAAGAGAFVYTYDGTARTIIVTSDTTLENLRDLISNDAQNPGVTASVLEYAGAYHLVLAGMDTGEDYGIAIDNFETTVNGFDSADFTETQQAENARLRVDGYPADPNWIERSSNTVADVLAGVTLTLKAPGSATVTMSRSTTGLAQDLGSLVKMYNELADKMDDYAGYDQETESRGLLQGDFVITSMLSGIAIDFVTQAGGFLDGEGGDTFTLPAHIGLEFDSEGHVGLDQTIFNDALSQDYLGVLSLVGALNAGASDSSYVQFTSAQQTTTAGAYEVEVDFDAQGDITAGRIRMAGETDWQTMSVAGSQLTGVQDSAAENLVLTAAWDGSSGTQTANVRVKRGFACAMYDKLDDLLDAIDGTVKLKKDGLSATIEQIDKNIETQERRLEAQETRLRAKFHRLEALLAQLDSQRGAFEAMFQALESNSNRTWG